VAIFTHARVDFSRERLPKAIHSCEEADSQQIPIISASVTGVELPADCRICCRMLAEKWGRSAKTLVTCCTAVCLACGHLLQIALKGFTSSWSTELFSMLNFKHFGDLIEFLM